MSIADHYVYVLFDPRSKSPFYVGKGRGRRWQSHYYRSSNDNPLKCKLISELTAAGFTPMVEKFVEAVDEAEALRLEALLIRCFGRLGLDEGGTLTNRSADGGPPSRSGISSATRGKTWEEIHGPEKAAIMREAVKERVKAIHERKRGKTLDQYYGPDGARAIRAKWSISRAGRTPWNKGLTKESHPTVRAIGLANSKRLLGKTLEDKVGERQAANTRAKMSASIRAAKKRSATDTI